MNNICIALLIILIKNPFAILDIGLILSFAGTIGIVSINNIVTIILSNKLKKIPKNIITLLSVSISAQIAILPISIIFFNGISTLFFISNILTSVIIGVIIILGFISIIIPIKPIFYLLSILISILNFIVESISNIPFSYITITTPNIIVIITYYIVIFLIFYYIKLKQTKQKRFTQMKVLKIFSKLKKKIKLIIFLLLLVCFICTFIKDNFRELNIYFIDVGQGESSLIITKMNKKLLLDTGGNTDNTDFDIGKNTLVPYLLDRGIMKLDFVIISHFDSDHCQGLIEVINVLKIDKLIISKQCKVTNEYEKIIYLAKKKNISIIEVKAGDEIHIDKYTSIEILYPSKELKFDDLNNNSIVCKLSYMDFSILFTGDIEKEAELEIVKKYNNTNKLRANILKIAHHGSKTSSSKEFLEKVKPQYALIGVGKDNKFGHPNGEVIERLENLRS